MHFLTLGWLDSQRSLPVLLLLAAITFATVVGTVLLVWRLLAKSWPPKEATLVLMLVVGARMVLSIMRHLGFWAW